jgi:hypothetical protein
MIVIDGCGSHEVEELDRIVQRQQALVMQVGRIVLDAAERAIVGPSVRGHVETPPNPASPPGSVCHRAS